MIKFIRIFLLILIIIGIGLLFTQNLWVQPLVSWILTEQQSVSVPVAAPNVSVVQHLNADAYPLYSELSWGAEQPGTIENLSGYETISAPITNITDLSAVSQPFDAYYKNKLETAGWTVDNSLAAGGPGDSITGYKKGNDYILYGYTTKFKDIKPNEPEQCPCDISFSVFSGTK
jgi:hypothetical protein